MVNYNEVDAFSGSVNVPPPNEYSCGGAKDAAFVIIESQRGKIKECWTNIAKPMRAEQLEPGNERGAMVSRPHHEEKHHVEIS